MADDFLSSLPHRVNPTEVGEYVRHHLDENGHCELDDLLTMVRNELWVHSSTDKELHLWETVAEGEWINYFKI